MKNKFLKKCLEIAVIVIGNAILAFGICAFITQIGRAHVELQSQRLSRMPSSA